jgi:hypothetical protein
VARLFDERIYKRGALALHALRHRIGDKRFFTLLPGRTSPRSSPRGCTDRRSRHSTPVATDPGLDRQPWADGPRSDVSGGPAWSDPGQPA